MTTKMIALGLPCGGCYGDGCAACDGQGHGVAMQLPLLWHMAEITPGLAGWSWTILHDGTPVDGGVRATKQDAITAVTDWLDAALDKVASTVAYAIVLRAVAEFGLTRTAVAAAFAAVALTEQIEDEDQEAPEDAAR